MSENPEYGSGSEVSKERSPDYRLRSLRTKILAKKAAESRKSGEYFDDARGHAKLEAEPRRFVRSEVVEIALAAAALGKSVGRAPNEADVEAVIDAYCRKFG